MQYIQLGDGIIIQPTSCLTSINTLHISSFDYTLSLRHNKLHPHHRQPLLTLLQTYATICYFFSGCHISDQKIFNALDLSLIYKILKWISIFLKKKKRYPLVYILIHHVKPRQVLNYLRWTWLDITCIRFFFCFLDVYCKSNNYVLDSIVFLHIRFLKRKN